MRDIRDVSVLQPERYYELFKKYVEQPSCSHWVILCTEKPELSSREALEFLGVKYIVFNDKQRDAAMNGPFRDVKLTRAGEWWVGELPAPQPELELFTKARVIPESLVVDELSAKKFRSDELLLESPPTFRFPDAGNAKLAVSTQRNDFVEATVDAERRVS